MVTLRGDDAAGHLVESTEISGIQGFEYGFALGNSHHRLDHLVTVTRGHQGAARVHNAMLILPIREEVCVWEFVSCVLTLPLPWVAAACAPCAVHPNS